MTGQGLADRVCVVTGGARGLGAQAAERLSGLGARVVIADVIDASALAERIGGRYVACDVSDLDDVERLMSATVTQFGRLDIVLANAGVRGDAPLGPDFDAALYRRAMSVNVDGVVFTVQAALPHLRASGGGRILVTASMAGLMAVPMDAVYAASKSAAVSFVRSIAPVLAVEDITVTAICPSFADTDILGQGRAMLEQAGFAIMPAGQVADAMIHVLERGAPGECWMVQAGRDVEPFVFRNPPGPRNADGSRMSLDQDSINRSGSW